MKYTLTLLSLAIAVSMVVAFQQEVCPRNCNHPKTEQECKRCLEDGVSDIVLKRNKDWISKMDQAKGVGIQAGGWHKWDSNRCWIHLKGIGSDNDCRDVGQYLFGTHRCSGFQQTDYTLANRCWIVYKA